MDDLTYDRREALEHDLYRVIKDHETLDVVVSGLMKAQRDAGGTLSYDTASNALSAMTHAGLLDTYTPKYVLAALYE